MKQMKQQTPISASAPADVAALCRRAEAGDAEAQFALAHCYVEGRGVAADEAEARTWFARAAAQGDADAQAALERMGDSPAAP